MRHSLKQRKQDGFTIIEVLIVLAIAGLILLVVFLAVPALQRNSRNTTAKSEASALASAATEFTSNNSGTLPTAGASTTAGTDAASIVALTKNKTITKLTVETGTTTSHAAPALDSAILDTGVKCAAASSNTITPTSGPTRAMVMIYSIENSAGTSQIQCVET